MPCSGFVCFLCLIGGSAQASFCDETTPYVEGHSVWAFSSVTSEAEGGEYPITFSQLSH